MSEKALTFEKAMDRIDEIVKILEEGKSTLDESLKLFEEATGLCNYCNNRLDDAKNRISEISVVKTDIEE